MYTSEDVMESGCFIFFSELLVSYHISWLAHVSDFSWMMKSMTSLQLTVLQHWKAFSTTQKTVHHSVMMKCPILWFLQQK